MKVILAHDSYTQYGGAERVLEGMKELYPDAPVYTLVVDKKLQSHIKGWKVISSPLQKIYNWYGNMQHLFGLIPFILPFFKLEKADLLLSSSSAYLKGLRKSEGMTHINYCHTPTRFIWTDYVYALHEVTPLLRPIAKIYLWWLKKWDYNAAQKVDHYLASGKEVQARIKKYYNRDSEILHPFIDVDFWSATRSKGDYFLIAGRLTPYKDYDKVILAFNKLGWPLHVIGTGRYEKYLRTIAGPNVVFLGRVDDESLRYQYSGARGFIYPQLEDFGMMPLEAASCNTATLALAKGGSLETVIPGQTGELLEAVDTSTLVAALQNWDENKYKPENLQAHAQKFSKQEFKKHLEILVNKLMIKN
ncbi:MAG TPA: glycosyltransferase [Patescibacteria group bacterium]|jgi:glycosyltransferase involved in cell wall biosynthesis|nr:glycosyltransferase [Patescibacteria group bacterium]